MIKVGLTGGIGAGKSEVSRLLAGHGAVIVDADQVAREVVEAGSPGLASVAAAFGDDIVQADGTLDRAGLGAIVFADESARRQLEEITHPLIRERMVELSAAVPDDGVLVHDNALLVEMGAYATCDVVVVVDVPTEVQVERLVANRGMSEQDALARIASQASRADRLAVADVVIDNTGSLEELSERVADVWRDLVSKAADEQTPDPPD